MVTKIIITKTVLGQGVAQVVEFLLSKDKALNLNLRIPPPKKKSWFLNQFIKRPHNIAIFQALF
jgi:hypothetical protein